MHIGFAVRGTRRSRACNIRCSLHFICPLLGSSMACAHLSNLYSSSEVVFFGLRSLASTSQANWPRVDSACNWSMIRPFFVEVHAPGTIFIQIVSNLLLLNFLGSLVSSCDACAAPVGNFLCKSFCTSGVLSSQHRHDVALASIFSQLLRQSLSPIR